jgi:hypothetical protein
MNASEPKHSWLHPTPDWVVLGLLVSTGVFFLSQQFQWFPLNRQKGWGVLLALAGVGMFLLVALLWFAVALLFRLRFQFTVRSLPLLTLAVALPFSWLRTEMNRAQEQKAALDELMKLSVDYRPSDNPFVPLPRRLSGPAPPAWLQGMLGVDFFSDVVSLSLSGPKITDAVLEQLEGLTQLESLELSTTKITDAGVKHLKALTRLRELELHGSQVTDAALEHLAGLTQLRRLDLHGTKVTGAGLKYLKGLARLEKLDLDGTQVTDAALKHLNGLAQLRDLDLRRTDVTDAGLEDLAALSRLQSLSLGDTKVTGRGVADLMRKLPHCHIARQSSVRL